VGKVLGEDRTADPICPRGYSIPYDQVKKRRQRRRRMGILLLQHLSSRATAMCTEAQLPTPLLRRGVIEQLGWAPGVQPRSTHHSVIK